MKERERKAEQQLEMLQRYGRDSGKRTDHRLHMRLPGDKEDDQLSSTGKKYKKTPEKTASSPCDYLRKLRLFLR